jgi:hypothetical protein
MRDFVTKCEEAAYEMEDRSFPMPSSIKRISNNVLYKARVSIL